MVSENVAKLMPFGLKTVFTFKRPNSTSVIRKDNHSLE